MLPTQGSNLRLWNHESGTLPLSYACLDEINKPTIALTMVACHVTVVLLCMGVKDSQLPSINGINSFSLENMVLGLCCDIRLARAM